MPNELTPHGVMEGRGAYNRYAKLPAGGAALAMPALEEAVRKVELGEGGHPFVIADYGSSQGKNSMIPMQLAIKTLRQRLGPDHPITVFHIDQPSIIGHLSGRVTSISLAKLLGACAIYCSPRSAKEAHRMTRANQGRLVRYEHRQDARRAPRRT